MTSSAAMPNATMAELVITDPTEAPRYGNGPLSRFCARNLHEARDEVFVRLTLRMTVVMSVLMASLWLALRYAPVPAWVPMGVYLAAWGWFTPPVILMLHCTMHRPLFKQYRFLTTVHYYLMVFFHGIPHGYREHHIGMHHTEDNMLGDLSSTIRYRRDSFLHFLAYFSRFFLLVSFELTAYLWKKRRQAMFKRVLAGEIVQLGLLVALLAWDWRFAVGAFVLPISICRLMMLAGNWGQHAFVNTAQPNNGLANSITCINTNYNQRAFNDGYHIGHHLKATRHWTEMPADFLANRDEYVRRGAVVFAGLDFFIVSLLLWTGQWKILARHYVRLDGPMSDDEVIAMLKSRVEPVREWQAEAISVAA